MADSLLSPVFLHVMRLSNHLYRISGKTGILMKISSFTMGSFPFAVPAVERVVYSTCSINQIENEDVVSSVLPIAESYGFQLVTPFPQWQRRGLPLFEGCK